MRGFSSTAGLLRYNNHICYATDVNESFNWFRCSTCDKFFRRSSNLQRTLPKYEDLVRHIYPRSVYQLKETVFNKLKAFDLGVSENKLLVTNFAVFDFESICVKSSTIAVAETTTWVCEHQSISVSITSSLLEAPKFVCDTELQSLVARFLTSMENLAEKHKLEMGLKLLNIGTVIREKLERITSTLNQRRRTFSLTSGKDQDAAFDTEDEKYEEKTFPHSFFKLKRTNKVNSNSILSVLSTIFEFLVSAVLSTISA